MKRVLRSGALLIALILTLTSLCSCLGFVTLRNGGEEIGKNTEKGPGDSLPESLSETDGYSDTEAELFPGSETEKPAQTEGQTAAIDESGYYYDIESVVLYLHTFGKLPSNYITKKEAGDLGWQGGSVEKYREGAAIGGDSFGNREGLLPSGSGRKYTECDIDTYGKNSRGAKRLIFSNDGLYFYTEDHYESFTELYVNDGGEVVRK